MLVALAQLVIMYFQEKRDQQQISSDDFREWLRQSDHAETLEYLKTHSTELETVKNILDEVRRDTSLYRSDLKALRLLLETRLSVQITGGSARPWRRPQLRQFERWHQVEPSDDGVIDRYGAIWRIRVPYQAELRSSQFQVSPRESLERLDPTGPFCRTCGVELISRLSESGLEWWCDGCEMGIESQYPIEEARAKVARVAHPRITASWSRKYGLD